MIKTIVLEFPGAEAIADLLSPWLQAEQSEKNKLFPQTALQAGLACVVKCRDEKGTELQLNHQFKQTSLKDALKFADFSSMIMPHIKGLDHTGIVLSENCISENKTFFSTIANGTACFRDKDCEDWLFVVPAYQNELERRCFEYFSVKRQPKFEIVLIKGRFDSPFIQIDLETDLSQQDAASLFPAPYGFGLSGLEQYFRSVWVQVSEDFVPVRFDLRYKGSNDLDDWNSGAHLMRDSTPFVF